jgi:hypothetical protein
MVYTQVKVVFYYLPANNPLLLPTYDQLTSGSGAKSGLLVVVGR